MSLTHLEIASRKRLAPAVTDFCGCRILWVGSSKGVGFLCGGDKRKQSADIERALEYLKDCKERTGTS
jgi:hypothetical protein